MGVALPSRIPHPLSHIPHPTSRIPHPPSRSRERRGRARRCQQMALFLWAVRPRVPGGAAPPGSGSQERAGLAASGNAFAPGRTTRCPQAPGAPLRGSLLRSSSSCARALCSARECEPSQTCGPTHSRPAGAKVITWGLCLGSVKVPGIIRKAVK